MTVTACHRHWVHAASPIMGKRIFDAVDYVVYIAKNAVKFDHFDEIGDYVAKHAA
jgi:hypothetical protein